jgi:hypothetical protein
MGLTKRENKALSYISSRLGVKKSRLYALIKFESNFKPFAKNPKSSAMGLIQFINSTAKGLGYKSSLDLVKKNPTIESQLLGPVYKYLSRYKPFPHDQALFMSVFYPKARYWLEFWPFPKRVKRDNPGINNPYDYMIHIYKRLGLRYVPRCLIFGIVSLSAYVLLSPKKRGMLND